MHSDASNLCCEHGALIVRDCDPETVNTLKSELYGGAVVVVYDITDPRSFDEAKGYVQKFWRKRWSSSLVVGLVGSKADLLMHRKIKYEVSSYYNYIHV